MMPFVRVVPSMCPLCERNPAIVPVLKITDDETTQGFIKHTETILVCRRCAKNVAWCDYVKEHPESI